MTSSTDDLVRGLAANVRRVRPLASPWIRVAVWLGVSAPYLLLLYVLWPHPAASNSIDRRLAIEQIAALTTALAAAVAAFSLTVPGRSRRIALVPLAPLAVWMLTVGQGCAREWSAGGPIMAILPHWECFVATLITGAVPAMLMLVMLRRGAPLLPRLTTLLGALAVAGLANVCVRFVHVFDSSFVVLTWHVAAVMALAAVLASGGEHAFNWRKVIHAK
jgi:hypothetical protein